MIKESSRIVVRKGEKQGA